MNALAHLSDIVIPILIFFIVGYGFVSGVKVYETFLKGAKDGLKIVVDIVPTLIGLLVAVGMLRASGFFEMLGTLLGPAAAAVGLPAQLLPLLVVKLFSSSASTGRPWDSSGSLPAFTPAKKTAGNSSPFAPWRVISRTAPDSPSRPAARWRSASSPMVTACHSASKLS